MISISPFASMQIVMFIGDSNYSDSRMPSGIHGFQSWTLILDEILMALIVNVQSPWTSP